MFVESPVMLLVNVPVPLPFVVWLSDMVGFCDVLQQIPLAVIVALPLLVTFPPHVAVLVVMLLTVDVVTVGNDNSNVVNVRSSPYAVPALFVAYARI